MPLARRPSFLRSSREYFTPVRCTKPTVLKFSCIVKVLESLNDCNKQNYRAGEHFGKEARGVRGNLSEEKEVTSLPCSLARSQMFTRAEISSDC